MFFILWLVLYVIMFKPTYLMQDGRTPLMVASGAGHLLVAKLLLETHRSNVNEEDSKVSGCEVMGRVSEYTSCVVRYCVSK